MTVFTDVPYANISDGASKARVYIILICMQKGQKSYIFIMDIKYVVKSITTAAALTLVLHLEESLCLRAFI